MSVTVKLDTRALDIMLAKVPGNTEQIVEQAARAVAAEAQKNIRGWPLIDTGALLNSIEAEPKKRGVWIVHDGVEYGVYWELGHKNIFLRRYARKPFLGPAIAFVSAKFTQLIARGMLR